MIALSIALAAVTFTWQDDGGVFKLTENGAPVLVYNASPQLKNGAPEMKRRQDYIHPLWAPNGAVVTDDFPRDHLHHRGLFWAWPVVRYGGKTYDIWTLTGGIESRLAGPVTASSSVPATLDAENAWFIDGKRALRETVHLAVDPAERHERRLHVTLTFEALDAPLELEGSPDLNKGYGGFSARLAPRTATVLRTDRGVEARDTDMAPHPWAEIEANFGGKQARLRLIDSPSNPGYPNGWCLRHYGFLGINYPGLKPLRLEPGKPLTLRYEAVVAGE